MMTLLYLLFSTLLEATALPEWHMKPIGSHVKPDAVDETFAHRIITSEDFANKYVLPRKPIVFRDIVKSWPASQLWTDEYLTEKYGELELRLEAKKEKRGMIPKGDVCLGRDTLRTFLKEYNKGADKYVVSELPTPMWGDVNVPPPMACGDFLTHFVEIDLWMNSDAGKEGKGGNSILHKDAFNTVNCVVNGTKEWKLFELQYNDYVYQSWEGAMDAGYGGFSLVNPDKVDANEFPNFGKIPRWQFVTINAGDCLYLPSQMWHQVKSSGVTNRAVAFLFSQFQGRVNINTTGCVDGARLSEVDVDLQYAGKGIMSMGNSEIESIRKQLSDLIDERTGLITPRRTYRLVYMGHADGAINKQMIRKKAKILYHQMLTIAQGEKEKMNQDIINNLSRDEIRATFNLIHFIEPSNGCNFEYSHFVSEDIIDMINQIKAQTGILEKEVFIDAYEAMGGTHSFAERFWETLAGTKLVINDITETIHEALRPYEEYRREKPQAEEIDENATLMTPQGHITQPRGRRGGYNGNREGEDINANADDTKGEPDTSEKMDEYRDVKSESNVVDRREEL